jgi:hypothetical protein
MKILATLVIARMDKILIKFQSIMAAAEDKANKTKIRAKLLHEVAVEK